MVTVAFAGFAGFAGLESVDFGDAEVGFGLADWVGSAVLLCSALGVAEGLAAGSEAIPIGSLESANAVGAVRAAPGATSAPASATTAPYRAAARAGR